MRPHVPSDFVWGASTNSTVAQPLADAVAKAVGQVRSRAGLATAGSVQQGRLKLASKPVISCVQCQHDFRCSGQMRIEHFEGSELVDPGEFASALRTSAEEFATTIGLGRDAPRHRELIQPATAQRRLRKLIEVLDKVAPRLGSELLAFA